MAGIGLTYDNKKDSLGTGIVIPGIFGNNQNNSYDPYTGAYYGGSWDEVTITASKDKPAKPDNNNRTWMILAASVLILIALVLGAKKFF